MDRPTYSQLNRALNGLSNFQGMPLPESGATGQAFSRMVTEVGQPVTNHDITDQSTSSDNQGYLNPKKKCLKDFAVQDLTSYNDSSATPAAISIDRIGPVGTNQIPKYIPENNPFSIYSILKDAQSTSQYASDVDTHLYQPLQMSNQGDIGIPSGSSVPIAIISPRLNSELQQNKSPAIQAEEVIDENSSHIERERERRADLEKRKLLNQRQRERYHKKMQDPEKRKLRNQRERERRADPEKRKLINQRERERYHEKSQDPEKRKLRIQRERERRADPEKRKLRNQRDRERYHEKLQDPEKRKLINQRERKRWADPEKRKLKNQRERERRADPEKRKLINQRQRERYHEKMQDPEKRKLINQSQKERYHGKVQDHEKRKLKNQRQRERYHEKVQDHEKRKLKNQRQQALPAISPSGAISQLSNYY